MTGAADVEDVFERHEFDCVVTSGIAGVEKKGAKVVPERLSIEVCSASSSECRSRCYLRSPARRGVIENGKCKMNLPSQKLRRIRNGKCGCGDCVILRNLAVDETVDNDGYSGRARRPATAAPDPVPLPSEGARRSWAVG